VQAGWGIFNESRQTSDVLQYIEIDAVTNDVCSRDYWLKYLTSDQTFCGGKIESKSGPCDGDSGMLIELNKLVLLLIVSLLQVEDSTQTLRTSSIFKE